MTYELPTNTTSFAETLFQYPNMITNGFMGISIFFAVWIVVFFTAKSLNIDNMEAFAFSSFVTTIFSLFMVLIDILPQWYMFIAVIATGLSVVYMLRKR